MSLALYREGFGRREIILSKRRAVKEGCKYKVYIPRRIVERFELDKRSFRVIIVLEGE